MILETQQDQAFGDNIVCLDCGIPKLLEAFANDESTDEPSAVCVSCVKKRITVAEIVVTPEDHLLGKYDRHLQELRNTHENQIVPGVRAAVDILGESPLEVMARMVKELDDPASCEDLEGIDPELAKALPKNRKLIANYLKMLMDAQVIADRQLAEAGNPYANMSPDDLRGMMLKGTTDHASNDTQLRMQLIRSFLDRCPTFLEEVVSAANERGLVPA
jgi:hypothetical protein